MKNLQRLLVLTLVLASAACTPLTRTGEEPLSPEEVRMRAMEGKLTELTRRQSALENRDESKLQDDLRNMRGEIERLRFDLETQIRKGRDVDSDFERRLQRLETQPGSLASVLGAAVAPDVPAPPPVIYSAPSTATPEANAGSAAEEQTAYLKAFDALKAGKYDGAIIGFQAMLDQWPQGNFADNGWYWLGESQYVKRQYKAALASYNTLVERFPASPKVPDALFKSGLTQLELGQKDQAKSTWRRVMKDYPNANAAGLARQRLSQTP